MLQGALSGLAAKAKAAAAKAGDAVGDFLDNSVDNPLYEDEEAEWSDEDEDEDEEDLDGDEDDGTDSPAKQTQSMRLKDLKRAILEKKFKEEFQKGSLDFTLTITNIQTKECAFVLT